MKYTRKSLIVFLAAVITASLIAEGLWIAGGPGWLMLLLMWMPGVSAMIAAVVSLREKKEKVSAKALLSSLHIKNSRNGWILLGVLIPLVYLLVPYMIYWKIYPENFAYTGVPLNLVLKDILPVMIIGVFANTISAAGEEIGWRGYLFPVVHERKGLKKSLFITGLFWCAWHLPLLIFGDYMAGAPVWYKVPAFILCILPVGIITGLLTYRSGSIWPAVFLHAAHNNFDQAVFGVITRGENMMYYVSETGCLTVLCAWVIALIMLRTIGKEN